VLLSPPPPPPAVTDDDFNTPFSSLPSPPPDVASGGAAQWRRSWVVGEADATHDIYEQLEQAEVPQPCRALYAYEASQDDDMSITAGERIHVLVARDDGWCLGVNARGDVGYFPASYVRREADVGRSRNSIANHLHSVPAHGPWVAGLAVGPMEGGGQGYGLVLAGHHPPRVYGVLTGSAAEAAGIRAGDVVLEVSGEPVADLDQEVVAQRLAALVASGGMARLCLFRPTAE